MSMHAAGSAAQGRLGPVLVNRMEFGPPPFQVFWGSMSLILVGAVIAGLGYIRVATSRDVSMLGVVGLGLGGVFLVAGIVGLVRSRSERYALTVHEQGVLVSHEGVEQAIAYSQVQDFSLKHQEQLNNGRHEGMLRTLSFAWPGGGRRILHFSTHETEQSFAEVVQRLLSGLADAAQARLGAGGSLKGEDWTLYSRGLSAQGQEPVRLDQLARVGLFEGKVSLWRVGEERPFLSVPAESRNARLLHTLAERLITGAEQPMAGALGRLLFQKGRLCVYERGVALRSFIGTRQLLYSELCGFRFEVSRNYRKGIYQDTRLSLAFVPDAGEEITYSHSVKGGDSDLELLREQVSGMVAARLLEHVKQGGEFAWGPMARFTKDGMVIQAKKLFGEGESRLVPYGPWLQVSIDGGICSLFIGNGSKKGNPGYERTRTNQRASCRPA